MYPVVEVVEQYLLLQFPQSMKSLNLASLSVSDYKNIREYIVSRLNKDNLNVKTCQLCYPCSPVDRSRKLNSLSNKISSVDYRCDLSAEVFRNYSVGIVVWNSLFSEKNCKLNKSVLKNQNLLYRTTRGGWKLTVLE